VIVQNRPLEVVALKPTKVVALPITEDDFDRFNVKKFVENFGGLAETDLGIAKLSELVLDLALRARLVSPNSALKAATTDGLIVFGDRYAAHLSPASTKAESAVREELVVGRAARR
jgi:hypothetical protein